MRNRLSILTAVLLCPFFVFCQPEAKMEAPDQVDVFIDCNSCNMNLIREQLNVVNYVRDPELAHVHVLVREQSTGSGSRMYELELIGKNEFEKINNLISFSTLPTMTYNERQEAFVKKLRIALIPFISQTELVEAIAISIDRPKEVPVSKAEDKDAWNYWVFRVNAGGNFRKQSTQSSLQMNFGLRADRVTEDLRIRSHAYYFTNNRRFDNEDGTITSKQDRKGMWGGVVRSVSDHWSWGVFSGINSSTFNNIKLGLGLTPAIEYNVFPYSEVNQREFTFAYKVGPAYRQYYETTIYDEMEEALFSQSLAMELRIRQAWGSWFATLQGSSFFHDFAKSRVQFNTNLNLRVYKGLSLRLAGNVELIRDQLALPKGDASLEDILLQQRQVATGYEAFVSLGVNYTFGSIYNNVVNTRL